MICLKEGAAINPFLASSKSRLSSKGKLFRKPFCSLMVNTEGIFPLGANCLPASCQGG
ncbi:hypothetical protein [Geminocystis sp. NIES-3709]|uniref:hypothetical protein n=1 Tax=Geminocystis sp. NIES-3709 TaxID=1617448 RepID=UPI00130E3DD6|nr:hypothetical protein [Geminocystis sp. NIES-3709]